MYSIQPLLFARRMGFRNSIAFGVLQSSKLSLTIAGVTIGVTTGVITENEATSLITFTIVACLISPTGGFTEIPRRRCPLSSLQPQPLNLLSTQPYSS
jgi:Kef-type K+ transport system membrane component KefB